ncbi:nucleotidyltransferase family protein [Aminipila sp.]|uniref:nucleotidyltransferase family protein n=1 Tax=Aminipila sp. TaxID=2060095 RepID=UPI00289BC260|nr:nucleotidyltransferase family protein [Aminipila sp.]
MEAIILAGGFGTRLSHIVSDVPKPMAPVAAQPFVKYIVDDLIQKGIHKVVFAVGYKKECIIDFFGQQYQSCKVEYSEEDMPLLTGGAIKKALRKCENERVFIINGDTFFDVDLSKMMGFHYSNNADITIASKRMNDFDRYGTLVLKENRIFEFKEKQKCENGIINGGIYLINKELLNNVNVDKFSFENDYLEKHTKQNRIFAFFSNGYFIDIGVEEDYKKAQKDFVSYEQGNFF